MPSANYQLIRRAIESEQQVTCTYQGHDRELCPHIIGLTDGAERLLAWQFGGQTSGMLPPGGAWKCLDIAKMSGIAARDGRWRSGSSHQKEQTCVRDIDLDINIHVRTGAR
jgi:hypothetical protein